MALISRRRRIARWRRTLALARRGFAATGVEDDLVLSALCCCGVRKLVEEGRGTREREREREERTSQREGSRRMKGREYLSAGGVRATPSSSFVSAGCRQATY